MVLHDLNLAARYADHLVAMADGGIFATGAPADVLTGEVVRAVFGMESHVIIDPVSGAPLMIPVGRHHHTGVLCRLDHGAGIVKAGRQRLFAEDMLARFRRRKRLLPVQFVGGGDINGIDPGIAHEFFQRRR